MSKDLNQPDLGPYRTPPIMPPDKVAVTLPVDRYDFAEEQANIDAAIAAGFEIVRGDDLHLLLDLDSASAPRSAPFSASRSRPFWAPTRSVSYSACGSTAVASTSPACCSSRLRSRLAIQ